MCADTPPCMRFYDRVGPFSPLSLQYTNSRKFSLKQSVIFSARTNHRLQCSLIAQTMKMALLCPVQPLVSIELRQIRKYRYSRYFRG